MKKLAFGFVALFAALVLVACGSDDDPTPAGDSGNNEASTPNPDGGPEPDVSVDSGGGEGIVLPDKGTGTDGDPPVGDGPAPTQCDPAVIGKMCTAQGGECGDSSTCLQTSETGGVCTCQCTPDDPQTDLVNEDTCPGSGKNTCGRVTLNNGQAINFCFQVCQPTLGQNTCTAPLVCSPRSSSITGGSAAVCIVTGCEKDTECPTTIPNAAGDGAKMCDTGQADSCDTAAGEECRQLTTTGTAGVCTIAGTCDKASGLCGKHATDKPDAKVGDTCNSDKDCGEYMSCEMELDRKTLLGQKDAGEACTADAECCGQCGQDGKCAGACTIHARNGYCLLSGCAFATASAWSEFACPDGSTCNKIFSGGICMKTCDLNDDKSCRGNDNDKYGDYECRAWNNLTTGAGSVADGPACDFGDFVPCSTFDFPGSTLTCAMLGLPGNPPTDPANPTDMQCRDILTGDKKTNDLDPAGFCLDNTASGDKVTP